MSGIGKVANPPNRVESLCTMPRPADRGCVVAPVDVGHDRRDRRRDAVALHHFVRDLDVPVRDRRAARPLDIQPIELSDELGRQEVVVNIDAVRLCSHGDLLFVLLTLLGSGQAGLLHPRCQCGRSHEIT
jgi:hypothetical protein